MPRINFYDRYRKTTNTLMTKILMTCRKNPEKKIDGPHSTNFESNQVKLFGLADQPNTMSREDVDTESWDQTDSNGRIRIVGDHQEQPELQNSQTEEGIVASNILKNARHSL